MLKKNLKYFYRQFLNVVAVLFLFFVLIGNSSAQSNRIKTIQYENQSLRELANEYLGNPDYWETILQFNNLTSLSELETGMDLEIPVGIVSSTLLKMDEAKSKISDANNNGAKVLTPKLVTEAELNFNKVLSLKQDGNWDEAYDTLQDVLRLASESLKQVLSLRESSADATISFTKGDVEKRKPSERLWNEADLFAKLYEADRTRTLANSVAEITFIDMSRIRLNENSQALIQHSRIDILKNITQTKVKLVKGDAFAYLLKSPKKKFDIDIPGLDVRIKSKSFWVEKETKATKIANYEGEIELLANNKAVVVKENQGSIIPDGGVPSTPKDLLPPPALSHPSNMKKIFVTNIELSWEEVIDAKQYWVELATDISFQKIFYSNKKNMRNSLEISDLKSGVYYWHVCTIDELGFPGEFSKQNYFIINEDVTKPFLLVTSPNNMEVTKYKTIMVTGEKESGLDLYINEKLIELDANTKFNSEVELNKGENKIVITSVDESGNSATIVRTIFYEPSEVVENEFANLNLLSDKSTIITNQSEVTLSGKTRSFSNIKYYFNKNEVSTFADTNGNYSAKLNIKNSKTKIKQVITTPAGYSKTSEFIILFDDKNPIINITSIIPKITKEELIKIGGEVIEGDSLFINSEVIEISNSKFEKTINLKEGKNRIFIFATDVANNRAEKNSIITKDATPPKLLEYKLLQDSKNKKEYLLKISASDISGLTKQTVATIAIDGVEKEMVLRMTSEGVYSKRIFVNSQKAKVEIKFILLKDYLGNSKKYVIK
jgi:hypothetical protein